MENYSVGISDNMFLNLGPLLQDKIRALKSEDTPSGIKPTETAQTIPEQVWPSEDDVQAFIQVKSNYGEYIFNPIDLYRWLKKRMGVVK